MAPQVSISVVSSDGEAPRNKCMQPSVLSHLAYGADMEAPFAAVVAVRQFVDIGAFLSQAAVR